MDEYQIRDAGPADHDQMVAFFNYYVEQTFSAYPERPVPPVSLEHMRKGAIACRVCISNGVVCGFSLLKPFLPFSTFDGSATVTYFLSPSHTGKGVGKLLLADLSAIARKKGIVTLLANVASRNEASLRFHEKNGFIQCGRFHNVGMKFNEPFDVVWYEKTVS